jgi:hypothetical protein
MTDFIQLCIILLGVFACGAWFGASGLKAMQEKEQRERLEQEWQDWERKHGH